MVLCGYTGQLSQKNCNVQLSDKVLDCANTAYLNG